MFSLFSHTFFRCNHRRAITRIYGSIIMKTDRHNIKGKGTWEDYLELRIPGVTDFRNASESNSRDGIIAKELEKDINNVRRTRAEF
jgi:hypothetical protein